MMTVLGNVFILFILHHKNELFRNLDTFKCTFIKTSTTLTDPIDEGRRFLVFTFAYITIIKIEDAGKTPAFDPQKRNKDNNRVLSRNIIHEHLAKFIKPYQF